MIVSMLPELRLQRERQEGRKLPVRVIAEESGLSAGAVQRLMTSDFERVETATLGAICKYFGCTVGDLLVYQEGKGQRAE